MECWRILSSGDDDGLHLVHNEVFVGRFVIYLYSKAYPEVAAWGEITLILNVLVVCTALIVYLFRNDILLDCVEYGYELLG